MLARLVAKAVGDLLFFATLGGLDAALDEPPFELLKALCLLSSGRDSLLQVLGPEVRVGVAGVESLRPVRDTVARRRALSHPQAVAPIQIILDANLGIEVTPTLLVLAPGFGVDGVPYDMDVRVLFVAVNEAGVVVTWCNSFGQFGTDFKQCIVRNLLGVGIRRIEVVARVVVLAAPLVIELLSRLVPRFCHLVLAL